MIVNQFLVLAALLFSIGIYGVLVRRNAVLVLLSIELMLTGVNINLVAFGQYIQDAFLAGQVFALFVITVAAAEVGIGLAIVVLDLPQPGIRQRRRTGSPQMVMLATLFALGEQTGHEVAQLSDGGVLAQWAWLIPVVPLVLMFAIVFFGKRLPMKGWELAEERCSSWRYTASLSSQ